MTPRRSVSIVALLFLMTLATGSPLWVAAQEEYMIGSRDVLKIVVWGHEDLSKEYPVDADGFIQFPLIGRAHAAGRTTQQFAVHLKQLLEKDYLVNPQVIVAVSQYLSKKVHVLGEAERAGLFYLSGPTTLLEIISKAGGIAKTAGKQLIVVRMAAPTTGSSSRGSVILRFDLAKIQAGDVNENIRLEDEDTIFIPKGQAFFVLGEVKTAGTFPLERATSVLEAITLAGGFNERAAPSGAKVIRRSVDGKQDTIPLDLSGTIPKDREFPVQDGDTILVPKGNTFFVFGEVKRPGAYQLEKDTNILEGITIAGGFTDRAAPGRVRVIRNTPEGQQVLSIDMNDVIKRGQRQKAIALQENDVVVVPESFF